MSSNEDSGEEIVSNGDSFGKVKQRFKARSKKVAQTKEILSKQANQTKEILSKQAVKIAKQAEEHESFLRPQDIPYVYCLFYVIFVPLRWIYYRFKKWHYYLLDFCYYANTIFLVDLLLYPKNEKLFMVCFSFAEGPLAWALIVWRCSLVFSSVDKIVSVLIHLLRVSAAVWNGGSFLVDVMPRQVILKEKKKSEMKPAPIQQDQSLNEQQEQSPNVMENTMKTIDSADLGCTES
ncbi:hypothetical protein GH714_038678 [Hevea brasiliensis]|uniref:Glycerophosphocholine acyltransferase 1 n=1 Tax=Hevea brasiliensis TaxID=3981 RepID=A0A6A6L800_HEVBR|nr:hypothetical protein GH714_038678 [Hevea brasiliensis]